MARLRFSTRSLIAAVALVGFDCAVMARAVQQGRLAHMAREYAIGFGAVLLVLNLALLRLRFALARPGAGGLRATPSPALIATLYLAAMAFAVLSVLFLSGRF